MCIRDRILIYAYGQGLKLLDHEDVFLMNIDPDLLGKMGLQEETDGTISIPVVTTVPAALMGSGLGSATMMNGDYAVSYTHLHHIIHPESDCVALKVKEQFTYSDAIKASLRQKPDWILVSEIRSREVTYLLEAVSTGAHLLSTIHCASAQSLSLIHISHGVYFENHLKVLHHIPSLLHMIQHH